MDAATPPRDLRWTQVLIFSGVGAMLAAAICALGATAMGHRLPFAVVCAGFLFGFALHKLGIASDTIVRLRRTVTPDPAQMHGSTKSAWAWIVYKLTAAAVSIGAGIYLLTAGYERVNGFFAH